MLLSDDSEFVAQRQADLPIARQLRAVEVLVKRHADFEADGRCGRQTEIATIDKGAAIEVDVLSAIIGRVRALGEAGDGGVVPVDRCLRIAIQPQGRLQTRQPAVAAPGVEFVIVP